MIAAAFGEAEARDPAHLRTWVVLVDGTDHQLDLIRAEAARRSVTIRIIIDIVHVLEYLWGATWSLHPAGDPPPRTGSRSWPSPYWLATATGPSRR